MHLLHRMKVRKTKIHVTDIAVVAQFSSNPGVSEYHVVAQMSLGEALLPATRTSSTSTVLSGQVPA